MAIPAKHRWYVYLLALALTLVAVRWAGGQDREPAASAAAQSAPRQARDEPAAAQKIPEIQLDKLAKRMHPTANGDPFQARSWEPVANAQQRRVAPPPPPPPQAPPLPFAYMGKLVDDGAVIVFLTKQDRNYIVRAGDTLDGTYGVESIEDERLVLNYLPLGIRQTLPFAASPAATAAGLPQPSTRQGLPPRVESRDEDEED